MGVNGTIHRQAPTRTTLSLRWSIRLAAARDGGDGMATLEWEIPLEGGGPGIARLRDASGTRELVAIDPARLRIQRHSDLLHVDSGDLLRATLRVNGSAAAGILYARTALIRELDLPGGRYEPASAEITRS